MNTKIILLVSSSLLFTASLFAQISVSITPVQDCGIFALDPGALSNGAGEAMITGRTNQGRNLRGIVQFDLSDIPANANILDVSLELPIANATNAPSESRLHRVLKAWGEGNSVATNGRGAEASDGDATWLHAVRPDELWDSPGGDFIPTPSATRTIENESSTDWEGAGILSDIQFWLENPESNFGWMIVGNESNNQTTIHFATRESQTPPSLTLTYEDVSTSVSTFQTENLKVWSNDGFIRIEGEIWTNELTTIEVYDMLGRRVHIQQAMPLNRRLDLSIEQALYSSNVYVVKIRQKDSIRTEKVFK